MQANEGDGMLGQQCRHTAYSCVGLISCGATVSYLRAFAPAVPLTRMPFSFIFRWDWVPDGLCPEDTLLAPPWSLWKEI